MENEQILTHRKWDCKYHIVWIPKYRKKKLYGQIRTFIGTLFKELAAQRGCTIIEGPLQSDHVHILISIPPKFAVAQAVGFLKGKSAIHIA
jgi:putative transposase